MQQHWERALQEHILHHHDLPHGVRLQRTGWWHKEETIARPLTHEENAPGAALVEDEPSGSGTKRRKIHVDPIVRDWFLDMMDQWRTQRRWSMQRCLAEEEPVGSLATTTETLRGHLSRTMLSSGLEVWVPGELKNHVMLDCNRWRTFADARLGVVTCVEAKFGLRIRDST